MKSFTSVVLAASILLVPLSGFAQQSGSTTTRAVVRAELIQLEQAGYSPSTGNETHYPADIQAAEAKVSTESAPVATGSVGGSESRSESGRRTGRTMASSCEGPVSFCSTYFGG
ncbi:DUF4148 domain-containing protein [Paraburkholderia sp. DHOC27]|uniref:DUF4148 domain-containing protein n=1 Tax=Paraburkholderia sp. DHOC27 TaxID=2303330 RepID=UPI000E3ECDCE|nr:DUF4148 domain-containing protein [Paraburkholderia sp. DHOC27]RFU49073.1 DUF4148 domain-containing protein [Paraburkholderia sp. DHOC27]